MRNKFNFDQVAARLEQAKRELPIVIANDTKNFFLSSWKKQGWEGYRWPAPKRLFMEGKSRRLRSAILVQSGKLRRAVADSLRRAVWESILFVVDQVPYAAIHNEGLLMKNGKRMPERRFMGDSKNLRLMHLKKIKSRIGKIW